MIDWDAALTVARAAVAEPVRTAGVVAAAERAGPVFRNRGFPLSPVPVFVRRDLVEPMVARLAGYVALLGKVVRLYRGDARVRAYYGLGAEADRLIEADTALGDRPWVCRLDGYLQQGSEELRILENNADSPAGTLFTGRVNALLHEVSGQLTTVREWDPALTYLGDDRFLGALRAAAAEAAARDPRRCADPRRIAVLQPAGRPNRESEELVEQLRAAGLTAFLADPAELDVDDGRAVFAGQAADLCWNKVNTVAWRSYCADEKIVDTWVRAVSTTSMVHVNPFGARYVAENKLSLALVQEPAFAGLFTPGEHALVAGLLPWARKLTPSALDPGGAPLADRLLADPREYVLKQHYDIRGDGVTLGHDSSPADWKAAVGAALRDGHVVQRRVAPTRYPVVDPGDRRVQSMAISLDAYVFGGRVSGFGAKASNHAKVNIFQGGRKLAVHVIPGARHD